MIDQELTRLWEVSDQRTIPPREKLDPIVLLENTPGGLATVGCDGRWHTLPLEDGTYEWGPDRVAVYRPEGAVFFVPLHPTADVLNFVDCPIEDLVQLCQSR